MSDLVQHFLIPAIQNPVPEKVFLQWGDKTLFYDNLQKAVQESAKALTKEFPDNTQPIIYVGDHPGQIAELLLASLLCGQHFLFLRADTPPNKLQDTFEKIGTKAIIFEGGKNPNFRQLTVTKIPWTESKSFADRLLKRSSQQSSWETMKANASDTAIAFCEDPATPSLILSSSGTTGTPKWAKHNHRSLTYQLQTSRDLLKLQDSTHLANVMNIHHIDGLTTGILTLFCVGGRMTSFQNQSLDQIHSGWVKHPDHAFTHLLAPPAFYKHWLLREREAAKASAHKPPQTCIATGDHLETETQQQWRAKTGIHLKNLYGMSEVGNPFFVGEKSESPTQAHGDEFCLVDENRNRISEPNQVGQLLVCGEGLFAGYASTEHKLITIDGKDWFPTGDLFSKTLDGAWCFHGRIKDLIVCGGINIHPQEINAILLNHDKVVDVATVGVPDPILGEVPHAYVVTSGGSVDLADFRFEKGKAPVAIHMVDHIPTNSSGKIDRHKLLKQRVMKPEEQSNDLDFEKIVFENIGKVLKVSPETLTRESSTETQPGWDSLAHLQIILKIEKQAGIQLTSGQMASLRSIGQIIEALKKITDSTLN